jgi:NAD(P)H-binding
MSDASRLVLLGATGATGRRVTTLALAAGLRPVLAGRDRPALEALAAPDDLEVRVGGLSEADLDRVLDGAGVVISSVGPYTQYGAPVVAAALRARAHYLDFSGEPRWIGALIDHFHTPAVERGCVLVGSVGLGVAADLAVQTCAAALPRLEGAVIGYRIVGMRPSPATLASTVTMFAGGAPVVEDGAVRYAPVGSASHQLPGGHGGLFPTPDPLLIAHTWPGASAACYMQGPLGRFTAPAIAGSGAVLRRPRGRALGAAAGRALHRLPGSHGGGGRAVAVVVASGGGATAVTSARVDDVYEFSARSALLGAQRLLAGAGVPGVRAWGSVTGDPVGAATLVGAELGNSS